MNNENGECTCSGACQSMDESTLRMARAILKSYLKANALDSGYHCCHCYAYVRVNRGCQHQSDCVVLVAEDIVDKDVKTIAEQMEG